MANNKLSPLFILLEFILSMDKKEMINQGCFKSKKFAKRNQIYVLLRYFKKYE